MTSRLLYEGLLIELNKVNAPNILLEDFNYFANKAINQYINKRYNIYDINLLTTDDLRVLKATAILKPRRLKTYDALSLVNNKMATYYVDLPSDYLHLLNCICIYNVNKTYKCYNKGETWRAAATRLTADAYSQVLDNFWLRPTYKRPYYYIHNINMLSDGENYTQETIPTNPYRIDSEGRILGTDSNLGEASDYHGYYGKSSSGDETIDDDFPKDGTDGGEDPDSGGKTDGGDTTREVTLSLDPKNVYQITYGDELPEFNWIIKSGYLESNEAPTITHNISNFKTVGKNYKVTLTRGNIPNTVIVHFDVSQHSFEIKKAEITATLKGEKKFTRGGTLPTYTLDDLNFHGFKFEENINNFLLRPSITIDTTEKLDSLGKYYSIKFSNAGNAVNYYIDSSKEIGKQRIDEPVEVTTDPTLILITNALTNSKIETVYGEDIEISYSIISGSLTIQDPTKPIFRVKDSNNKIYSINSELHVGEYTIELIKDDDNIFEDVELVNSLILKVIPRTLNILVRDIQVEEDDYDEFPDYSFVYNGFKKGHSFNTSGGNINIIQNLPTVTVTASGLGTYHIPTDLNITVGEYALELSGNNIITSEFANDYTVNFIDGTLTVVADTSIYCIIDINDVRSFYGETPSFTYQPNCTNGKQLSGDPEYHILKEIVDTYLQITYEEVEEDVSLLSPGEYVITATKGTLTLDGNALTDGLFSVNNGRLYISKAEVNVVSDNIINISSEGIDSSKIFGLNLELNKVKITRTPDYLFYIYELIYKDSETSIEIPIKIQDSNGDNILVIKKNNVEISESDSSYNQALSNDNEYFFNINSENYENYTFEINSIEIDPTDLYRILVKRLDSPNSIVGRYQLIVGGYLSNKIDFIYSPITLNVTDPEVELSNDYEYKEFMIPKEFINYERTGNLFTKIEQFDLLCFRVLADGYTSGNNYKQIYYLPGKDGKELARDPETNKILTDSYGNPVFIDFKDPDKVRVKSIEVIDGSETEEPTAIVTWYRRGDTNQTALAEEDLPPTINGEKVYRLLGEEYALENTYCMYINGEIVKDGSNTKEYKGSEHYGSNLHYSVTVREADGRNEDGSLHYREDTTTYELVNPTYSEIYTKQHVSTLYDNLNREICLAVYSIPTIEDYDKIVPIYNSNNEIIRLLEIKSYGFSTIYNGWTINENTGELVKVYDIPVEKFTTSEKLTWGEPYTTSYYYYEMNKDGSSNLYNLEGQSYEELEKNGDIGRYTKTLEICAILGKYMFNPYQYGLSFYGPKGIPSIRFRDSTGRFRIFSFTQWKIKTNGITYSLTYNENGGDFGGFDNLSFDESYGYLMFVTNNKIIDSWEIDVSGAPEYKDLLDYIRTAEGLSTNATISASILKEYTDKILFLTDSELSECIKHSKYDDVTIDGTHYFKYGLGPFYPKKTYIYGLPRFINDPLLEEKYGWAKDLDVATIADFSKYNNETINALSRSDKLDILDYKKLLNLKDYEKSFKIYRRFRVPTSLELSQGLAKDVEIDGEKVKRIVEFGYWKRNLKTWQIEGDYNNGVFTPREFIVIKNYIPNLYRCKNPELSIVYYYKDGDEAGQRVPDYVIAELLLGNWDVVQQWIGPADYGWDWRWNDNSDPEKWCDKCGYWKSLPMNVWNQAPENECYYKLGNRIDEDCECTLTLNAGAVNPNFPEEDEDSTSSTTKKSISIVQGITPPNFIKINDNLAISNVERGQGIRYGNVSRVRLEIRYGTDSSVFSLDYEQGRPGGLIYIDYLKAPQHIRLTLYELDLTEDTSQVLEYPDYVCQEIINELTHIVMENISDPKLQTHPVVSLSIANPAQTLAPEAAGQSAQ